MTHRPIRPDIRIVGSDERGDHARALRDAFSAWASGVTVVAVQSPSGMHGITASAFTPLSVTPPLVLVCLAGDAPMLTYIREQRRFTVNVLDAAQKRIASLYADRFTAVHARFADEIDAIIDGVAAYFVCTLVREHDGGDHRIVMGEVQRFAGSGEAAPLVYHGRSWHALALGSDQ